MYTALSVHMERCANDAARPAYAARGRPSPGRQRRALQSTPFPVYWPVRSPPSSPFILACIHLSIEVCSLLHPTPMADPALPTRDYCHHPSWYRAFARQQSVVAVLFQCSGVSRRPPTTGYSGHTHTEDIAARGEPCRTLTLWPAEEFS